MHRTSGTEAFSMILCTWKDVRCSIEPEITGAKQHICDAHTGAQNLIAHSVKRLGIKTKVCAMKQKLPVGPQASRQATKCENNSLTHESERHRPAKQGTSLPPTVCNVSTLIRWFSCAGKSSPVRVAAPRKRRRLHRQKPSAPEAGC